MEPAPHAMGFFGAADDVPWAEIQAPAGWSLDRVHLVTGPDLDAHLRRIETFAVERVAPDPCQETLAPVGPDVADLMTAMAATTRGPSSR